MKRIFAMVLLLSLMVSMCACTKIKDAPAAADESVVIIEEAAPAPTETASEFTWKGLPEELTAQIESVEAAILGVYPGTAGCSLRTMQAVGRILDLSNQVQDCDPSEFEHVCRLWIQNNLQDESLLNTYHQSYLDVWERINAYLQNPQEYAGEVESCGYPFPENYSSEQVEWVLNYMAIASANAE